MKKVSIIIPNYNNSKYIYNCIESVINQTYKNIEIILVDDGSTDNSREIIEMFNDKRIIKIYQFNQNAAIARNRALELITGEYVYFIDSDDELYDEYILEKLVNDIGDKDLLIGNYIQVNENSEEIGKYLIDNDYLIDIDEKFKYSLVSPVPSNKLYKSTIIKYNNLFFDNVRIGQDLNFYLKYLIHINSIKVVSYNLYKYRVLSTSMSRINNLNFLDIYNALEYTKKYYKKCKNIAIYDKYISLVELLHYNSQFNKIKKIKNRKERKAVYSFFKYCISNINYKKCYKDKNYKELCHKILIKMIFYKF